MPTPTTQCRALLTSYASLYENECNFCLVDYNDNLNTGSEVQVLPDYNDEEKYQGTTVQGTVVAAIQASDINVPSLLLLVLAKLTRS